MTLENFSISEQHNPQLGGKEVQLLIVYFVFLEMDLKTLVLVFLSVLATSYAGEYEM